MEVKSCYDTGGFGMNDPEVMERIANALERIAFFFELHVRGEEWQHATFVNATSSKMNNCLDFGMTQLSLFMIYAYYVRHLQKN